MVAIESSVQAGLANQLGLEVSSVTCPHDGRKARSGEIFQCEARPAVGGRLFVEVTQKDAAGNIGWKVTKSIGLFDLQAAAAAVEQGLRDQMGLELAVSCGSDFGMFAPSEITQLVRETKVTRDACATRS